MKQYIVVSGIDGSGKTSVIEHLKEKLNKNGIANRYIWMRFNHYSVKIMNALARILGLSVPVMINNEKKWQHRFYKSPLFCRIYILCSYLDNLIALHKLLNIKEKVILCDRWIPDTLVDLGAECRKMDLMDSKWFGRFMKILPAHSIKFLIDRDIADIIQAREENSYNPDFSARHALYQQLKKKAGIICIENTGTIEQSVDSLLKNTSYEIH